MIKLIASDMDGTLLDESSQVPEETYEAHSRPAGTEACTSPRRRGRRFDKLCQLLRARARGDGFRGFQRCPGVCRGASDGREVYSHFSIRRLAKTVALFDNLHLALFDRTKSFLLDDEGKFVREVDKDLPNAERIWELPDAGVNIIKASVFCSDGNVMGNAYVLTQELGDDFVFAPSGSSWIDCMQPGVSKATGVQLLDGALRPPSAMRSWRSAMR